MLEMIKDILEATAPNDDEGRLLISMHAKRSIEIEKALREFAMGVGRLCANIEPMINEAATLFDPGLHPSARKAAVHRASQTLLKLLPARCSASAGAGRKKKSFQDLALTVPKSPQPKPSAFKMHPLQARSFRRSFMAFGQTLR